MDPQSIASLAALRDALARQILRSDTDSALFDGSAAMLADVLDAIDGEPHVPILSRFENGWPGPKAGQIVYTPLAVALTEHFPFDAHSAAYFDPTRPYRLNYGALDGEVRIETLQIDTDCPKAHLESDGAAPEWWLAAVRDSIRRIDAVHPGGFWNQTRKGIHGVYRLAKPWTIGAREHADAFRRFYLGVLVYLDRAFGFVGDPAMATWNQLFRLPHVHRDGVDQLRPCAGDPFNVGFWTYEPTTEDMGENDEPRAARVRRPPLAPPDASAADPLVERAARVGVLGAEVAPGKYVAICPNERHHTSNTDGTTSTVMWRAGAFHCSHAHCAEIGRRDFARTVECRTTAETTLENVERDVGAAIVRRDP